MAKMKKALKTQEIIKRELFSKSIILGIKRKYKKPKVLVG